ncbi:MAG TPA: trypsin-like serine protease [Nannocystaceae bacterium]|nr:trypsin-like serine protease [Nannocystaceae bacterium]
MLAALSLLLSGLVQPGDPDRIVGGTDVAVCDFPASVFIGSWGGFHCTASLVHPRVIITAAHCIGGIEMIGFGEDVWSPAITVATESCAAHPDYDYYGIDLGVCTLAEDAPAVAMVPALMGCEADELTPGHEIVLAGFGQDDEASGGGGGVKRTTTNTVDAISLEYNEAYLLGNYSGSCYGDSGGPAYVQLADGSWRVFAAVSGPHPNAPPLGCGYGGTYELIWPKMDWIEEWSGYDVTPCFDADGTWNPDERCTEFPLVLDGGGSWNATCGPAMVSGPSNTCGDGPMGTDDGGGGDETSGDDGGGETGHTSGHDPTSADDDSGGGAIDDGGAIGDSSSDDAAGDVEDDGGAPMGDPALPPGFGLGADEGGCAIAHNDAWWWLLVLVALGYRRSS